MKRFDITEQDRVLIVAPHPDDESIGAGGVIALYPKHTDVLVVSDGRKGHDKSITDDECISIRKQELHNAMNILKPAHIFEMALPDGRLAEYENEIEKFDISSYKYVFIPHHCDFHPDHQAVYRCFLKMVKSKKGRNKCKLIEYEVWQPIVNATLTVDISNVFDIKEKALKEYKSQIKTIDYLRLAKGLNMYRGAVAGILYAEGFSFIEDENVSDNNYFLRKLLQIREKIRHMK